MIPKREMFLRGFFLLWFRYMREKNFEFLDVPDTDLTTIFRAIRRKR